MRYLIGVDLGQAQDYTALVVVERHSAEEPALYFVRHIERMPLGTRYPDVVGRIKALTGAEPLRGCSRVVVDATGVGAPVVDMLRREGVHPIVPVLIHGGDATTREDRLYRVPKRDLVGALQVLLQTGRLKIARELPLADVLVRELLNFRVRINVRTAHDSYEAWREGEHDDLVLATALACWYGERIRPVRVHVLHL